MTDTYASIQLIVENNVLYNKLEIEVTEIRLISQH